MMRRWLTGTAFLVLATGAWAQLSLSDFVVPAGQTTVMAFVGVAGGPIAGGGPWTRYLWGPDGVARPSPPGGAHGSIAEGSAALAADLTVAAIRCQNDTRCQLRASGTAGFATYFEGAAPYDAGTWYWQDDTEVLSFAGSTVADSRVGGGFYDVDERDGSITMQIAGKMWELATGDRFILAFTLPAPPDNCDVYIGDTDLTAPGDFRIGDLTPVRMYLGDILVCGDAP